MQEPPCIRLSPSLLLIKERSAVTFPEAVPPSDCLLCSRQVERPKIRPCARDVAPFGLADLLRAVGAVHDGLLG